MCSDKGLMDPLQQLLRCLGSWAVAECCWKTHSWPLKRVVLRVFTTPCSTSSWYTQAYILPISSRNEYVTPDGKTYRDEGSVMASLHPQNSPHETFEHKSCCSGCYTSQQEWKVSIPGEYFRVYSGRTSGGDALLLYAGFSSKHV